MEIVAWADGGKGCCTAGAYSEGRRHGACQEVVHHINRLSTEIAALKNEIKLGDSFAEHAEDARLEKIERAISDLRAKLNGVILNHNLWDGS